MGAMVSSTWFTYGRNAQDEWLEEPIDSTVEKCENVAHHVGKFKHKFFQSAIGRKFEDIPKIYLYQGFRRIKFERTETQMIIHFADKEILDAWKKCKRSKLGKIFDEQYSLDETNKNAYMYIFNKKTLI